MIARTPFDEATLTLLSELDLASLPPGTTIEREIDGTTFYRVSWLLAQRGQRVYFIGDDEAARELERLATVEQEIAALLAEKQRLLEALLPATPPKAPKPPAALVRCAVDGCEVEKPYGTALAMHRQRKHAEWFKRQIALANDDPRKAERTGAIITWEAAQTDQLPATEQPATEDIATPEVAAEPAPFQVKESD